MEQSAWASLGVWRFTMPRVIKIRGIAAGTPPSNRRCNTTSEFASLADQGDVFVKVSWFILHRWPRFYIGRRRSTRRRLRAVRIFRDRFAYERVNWKTIPRNPVDPAFGS